jgi:hypothetical protein
MSEQLVIVLQRLHRIETMLAQVLHEGPEKIKKRLPEKEVIKKYGIGRARLRQLRQGFRRNGVFHDPVLFKWGHRGGRHIDYDVEELEQVLKHTIIHD